MSKLQQYLVLVVASTRFKKLTSQEVNFSKALTSLKVYLLREQRYGS
jgi:hypothetical protein